MQTDSKKPQGNEANTLLGLVLSPIMHGDCWEIKNKLIKCGYAQKRISTVIRNDFTSYSREYYEIDGKVDVLFDCRSKYGVIWFFPN